MLFFNERVSSDATSLKCVPRWL